MKLTLFVLAIHVTVRTGRCGGSGDQPRLSYDNWRKLVAGQD
jgi:hypothetical protein